MTARNITRIRGGQPGNANAMRHAGRIDPSRRYRLQLGELPSSMARCVRDSRRYRADLEFEVYAIYGEVDAVAAHWIDVAAGSEMHASVCRWLLREKLGDMTSNDILACSKELLKARETRVRAVQQLNLHTSPSDRLDAEIQALYSEPWPHEDQDTNAQDANLHPSERSDGGATDDTPDNSDAAQSEFGTGNPTAEIAEVKHEHCTDKTVDGPGNRDQRRA